MEDLTKSQVVLLSALVSFVIGLSTSIMTYAFLADEPLTIDTTINKVIERTNTIERIIEHKAPATALDATPLDIISGVDQVPADQNQDLIEEPQVASDTEEVVDNENDLASSTSDETSESDVAIEEADQI